MFNNVPVVGNNGQLCSTKDGKLSPKTNLAQNANNNQGVVSCVAMGTGNRPHMPQNPHYKLNQAIRCKTKTLFLDET